MHFSPFKKKEKKKLNIKYAVTLALLGLFFPLVLFVMLFRFIFKNKKKL